MLDQPIGPPFLTMYATPSSHLSWLNRVLQIKELKYDFAPGNSPSEEEDLADSNRGSAPDDSIFSLISLPSLEIILQSLPPRPMVDRRLSVYFKAKYAIIREFL
jgi:hypothetical protein